MVPPISPNMVPPISPKKLEEEEAWETRKEILDWLLDGIQKTIQLPTKKCDALITLLQDMNKKRDISVEDFQIIQGKTTICIHWDSI